MPCDFSEEIAGLEAKATSASMSIEVHSTKADCGRRIWQREYNITGPLAHWQSVSNGQPIYYGQNSAFTHHMDLLLGNLHA